MLEAAVGPWRPVAFTSAAARVRRPGEAGVGEGLEESPSHRTVFAKQKGQCGAEPQQRHFLVHFPTFK